MTDFAGLLYLWIVSGFLIVFFGIQIWALDFFLDKIKNKFGTGWFWVQIYLFIFWIFGGEFIAFGYLLTCLTE